MENSTRTSSTGLVSVWTKLRSSTNQNLQDDRILGPLEWAFERRRLEGRPFSLAKHKPLLAIYEDDHPNIAVIKPAQVGVSEWAISHACWVLEYGSRYWKTEKDGLNVGYIFPTSDALREFSKERISGLAEETPELASLFTGQDFNDVTFKKVGRSYLYLRGGWSKRNLRSFPADVMIIDEYDEMDPLAIAMASMRLRASPVARQIAISTPTRPGEKIHALYLQSDQRVWQVPCPGCAGWVELDFFRDVRGNDEEFEDWQYWHPEVLRAAEWKVVCPYCSAEMNRFADGRWHAKRPEVTGVRGYYVPALCFPAVNIVQIVVDITSDDPDLRAESYRSHLGLPYDAAGSRITDTMLRQLSVELDNGILPRMVYRNVTMGVDVGARFHYRISADGPHGKRMVIAMGAVREWDEIDQLMREHKVRRCVVDANPELHGVKEFVSRWPGRAFKAYYTSGPLDPLVTVLEEKQTIKIARTLAMDDVFAEVKGVEWIWPDHILNDPEVISHMKAPQRIEATNAKGEVRPTWNHSGPDHLFHASVYDRAAFESLPKVTHFAVLAQGRARGGWGGTL